MSLSKAGFKFRYHFDIVQARLTYFTEGYNQITRAYLKSKIGDSAYALLDSAPKDYFNPRAFIDGNMKKFGTTSALKINVLTDSTVNVKLIVDSLFQQYPQFLKK